MARKKRRRKKTKKTGGRRGRRPKLASVSTADLHAELERREEQIADLEQARDSLQAELDDLEGEIAVLSGAGARTRGRRRRRRGRPPGARTKVTRKKTTRKKTQRRRRGKKSLADTLHDVLRGKTLTVADATDAVQHAGYASKSPNLRTMVNQQLLANPDRFKKVSRGEYTAK